MTAEKMLMNARWLCQHPNRLRKYGAVLTGNGKPRHLLEGARKAEYKRYHQADDTKHDGASAMVCQGVHHDGEGEHVAAHDED